MDNKRCQNLTQIQQIQCACVVCVFAQTERVRSRTENLNSCYKIKYFLARLIRITSPKSNSHDRHAIINKHLYYRKFDNNRKCPPLFLFQASKFLKIYEVFVLLKVFFYFRKANRKFFLFLKTEPGIFNLQAPSNSALFPTTIHLRIAK